MGDASNRKIKRSQHREEKREGTEEKLKTRKDGWDTEADASGAAGSLRKAKWPERRGWA